MIITKKYENYSLRLTKSVLFGLCVVLKKMLSLVDFNGNIMCYD